MVAEAAGTGTGGTIRGVPCPPMALVILVDAGLTFRFRRDLATGTGA